MRFIVVTSFTLVWIKILPRVAAGALTAGHELHARVD